MTDLFFGWMFQFGPNPGAANMEITSVILSSSSISINEYVEVEVLVTNQGSTTASGYDVVLIPHYGWGPPNPGGYDAVPDLAPGASHMLLFSPGVLYGNAGDFTLRVLLTDDWYQLGDPDSTGTAGDISDHPISVAPELCFQLDPEVVEFVILNLPADTRNLPVYLKVPEGIFPGFDPEELNGETSLPYIAELGDRKAYLINQQGFPNRAYFMFNIPEGMEGTEQRFALLLPYCEWPVIEFPAIQVPIPQPTGPTCSANLSKEKCEAAGGRMSDGATRAPYCICP
jgi:hypothetical protein